MSNANCDAAQEAMCDTRISARADGRARAATHVASNCNQIAQPQAVAHTSPRKTDARKKCVFEH